jgi:hypothetical protein
MIDVIEVGCTRAGEDCPFAGEGLDCWGLDLGYCRHLDPRSPGRGRVNDLQCKKIVVVDKDSCWKAKRRVRGMWHCGTANRGKTRHSAHTAVTPNIPISDMQ